MNSRSEKQLAAEPVDATSMDQVKECNILACKRWLFEHYSPATAADHFSLLKRAFNRAKANDIIRRDVSADIVVKKSDYPQVFVQEVPGFSDEELRKIYTHIDEVIAGICRNARGHKLNPERYRQLRKVFEIGENTALRPNDIASMRKSQVGALYMEMRASKNRRAGVIEAFESVRRYVQSIPETPDDPDPPLFSYFYSAPGEGAGALKQLITRTLRRCGVRTNDRKVSLKHLRRRVARILPPLQAKAVLLHDNLDSTSIYAQADKETTSAAVKTLKKKFVGGKTYYNPTRKR